MARTQANAGYGIKFYIGDGGSPETFTKVGETESVTPPDVNLGVADATHMESDDAFMEDIPTMLSSGEATIGLNFLPTDPTQALLAAAQYDRRTTNFRMVLPSGTQRFEFAGHITKIGRALPKDDRMSMTVTIKATGKTALVAHS